MLADGMPGRFESPLRVLIADDHRLFAEMLATVLSIDAHVEVTGIANDGEQAVQMATELDPMLVLMDVNMPKVDGLEATRRLRAAGLNAGIILLTGAEDAPIGPHEALAAGANAFFSKKNSIDDLLDVFSEVASLSMLLGKQPRVQ